MKVWVKSGDTEAEVTLRAGYSPDVLRDACNRVTELVITQRAADLVLTAAELEG